MMTTDGQAGIDDEVLGERRHLVSLAFRMLGTVAEAEDAVQETYLRWYRLTPAERDAIDIPRAWLTRAASRILDVAAGLVSGVRLMMNREKLTLWN